MLVERYSLVIVQHPETEKFVSILETDDRGWWVTGGHVETGESYVEAAHREVLEEAGIKIELKGIICVKTKRAHLYHGIWVIFYAHPIDDTPLKSIPDSESLKAYWVTLEGFKELEKKDGSRGSHLIEYGSHILEKKDLMPLSILEFPEFK